MSEIKNYGLIQKKIIPNHWLVGSNSPVNKFRNDVENWTKYLPTTEKQRFGSLETMACVSFSALNALEILIKHRTRKEVNLSDRFLAKMSDTTRNGNWLHKVAETVRKSGLLLEKDWKVTKPHTWDNYYREIPEEKKVEALKDLESLYFSHEWVHENDFRKELKDSPLQVTVNAWIRNTDDIYFNTENKQNHAVVLICYEGDNPIIFDSYAPYIKKLTPDYKFGTYAKKFTINKNFMSNIKDNHLYQLVSGKGGFALGLDDQLIVDDLAKITASFLSRNDGNIDGRTVQVTQDFWDSITKVNLKGETV